MDKHAGIPVTKQIEELVNREDLGGLERLIQNLDADDLHKYKTELVEACLEVFYIWYQDLELEKVRKGDEDQVISDLFDLLLAAEKIDPDKSQHDPRARLYEHIAEFKTEPDIKLQNIQKAIDEYAAALQKEASAEMEVRLGKALLNRMQITRQFTEAEFTNAFQWLQKAFASWSESVFTNFLHSSFEVLTFPCSNNRHWHLQFMKQLEMSLVGFAEKEPIIYLTWSNELLRVLQYEVYAIPAEYVAELSKRSLELLEHLKDYSTNDTWQLNQLGSAFEGAAKRLPVHATAEKLGHYEIAQNYYLKGQSINPAAWTFPVYATNVQMAMARIYHSEHNHEKVKALFEAGRFAFSTTYEYDQEFTLMIYWGDFLIEYARLAYQFNAPDILLEAEGKLLIAKEKGRGFYSRPYLSLAKVALKSGSRQQCLDILQECKRVFTTEYYQYDFADVLKDEDFKEVWSDILAG